MPSDDLISHKLDTACSKEDRRTAVPPPHRRPSISYNGVYRFAGKIALGAKSHSPQFEPEFPWPPNGLPSGRFPPLLIPAAVDAYFRVAAKAWTKMTHWICLFRGINVGGKNRMPMEPLRSVFHSLNCKSVRTYIQSGNVVFESASKSKANLSKRLVEATEKQFGFRPTLVLLTAQEFESAIENQPFGNAASEPKTLHFFFLDSEPESPDLDTIAERSAESESYELDGSVFYLHTPNGFGKSKLAANVERILGVPATARNFVTIEKLSAMLAET